MTRSEGRRLDWVPFLVLGAVVLGASYFYWQPVTPCLSQQVCTMPAVASSGFDGTGLAPLFPSQGDPTLYWLIALPVAFLACMGFFWWRGSRGGTYVRFWVGAVVGLVLLVLVTVMKPAVPFAGGLLPGDMTVRGLVALLIIGMALLVWALVEWNLTLGVVAALFFGLALLANLYDIENQISFGNSLSASGMPNLVLPGLALLVGGLVVWITERGREVTGRTGEPTG